ncbi:hypothetical protein N7638_17030 [Achromobacter mucicolens]|uniref:hypothetical protein n=1 Tax=Achromobacter TaxID=222 RepID=UPI0009EB7728|nr:MULTISPECIES: hypothetical protein [Achromobacter]MDG9969747.1 hypothetical protein [Achromobacter mucicolens]
MAQPISSSAPSFGQNEANPATVRWLEGQTEFRSDDANVVRTFVTQLLRDGTLSLVHQNLPAYVVPALAEFGLAEAAAHAVWQQFSQDTNQKSSPSGRCRSEVRRKASFLLWLRSHLGKPALKGAFRSDVAGTSIARAM